jgi:hypothetical protein
MGNKHYKENVYRKQFQESRDRIMCTERICDEAHGFELVQGAIEDFHIGNIVAN